MSGQGSCDISLTAVGICNCTVAILCLELKAPDLSFIDIQTKISRVSKQGPASKCTEEQGFVERKSQGGM